MNTKNDELARAAFILIPEALSNIHTATAMETLENALPNLEKAREALLFLVTLFPKDDSAETS